MRGLLGSALTPRCTACVWRVHQFVSIWESLFLCFLFYVTVRVPFFIAFTRRSEWYTEVGDFLSTLFFICDIGVRGSGCA